MGYDRRWKVQAEDSHAVNVTRLERLVEHIAMEASQMQASLNKYKQDPGKYKPQLDNVAHSAGMIETSIRVMLRTLGKGE